MALSLYPFLSTSALQAESAARAAVFTALNCGSDRLNKAIIKKDHPNLARQSSKTR